MKEIKVKLWSARFKHFLPFHEARRIHIQDKWNKHRGRSADNKGLLWGNVGRPIKRIN